MSGNAAPALCALVGLSALARRGRGDAHGRSEAGAARGIGQGGQHRASGEVTGRGMVGGALPRSCALGGHGDAQGRRGVCWVCLCIAGPG
jgi:hypothetical protein